MSTLQLNRRFLAILFLLLQGVFTQGAVVSAQEPGQNQQEPPELEDINGEIIEVRQGVPYKELSITCGVELCRLRLGEPWRNSRAGLRENRLKVGQAVTARGYWLEGSAEPIFKVLRVVLDGRNYDLYPNEIR